MGGSYKLGQISLPRLEKINKSMSWESSLFFSKEQWANPKVLILNKLFASYILNKQFSFFKKNWKKKFNIYNFFFKLNRKYKSYKFIRRYNPFINNKLVLGIYIYQFNNSYVTIIVYASLKHRVDFLNNLKKLKWFNLIVYLIT